jgi:dTDP-4-dehydrorhamnose reductase
MSNILVFGGNGQLGSCLKIVAAQQEVKDIRFLSGLDGDILDIEGLFDLFTAEKPAFVINCAAYTNVDKAENDLMASRINTDGAQNLADVCKAFNTTIIHISTDYVFGGYQPKVLDENDRANPVNNYGQTKFEGEQSISKTAEKYFILRTSWLYSEQGNNFVKTMLRLGTERDELKVIVDQVGSPTYAMDLARMIFLMIDSGITEYGIYHYSNEGVASWYDFAKAIFDMTGMQVKLLPITSAEYPTLAIRPTFTVLNKAKFKNTFLVEIPNWRDSLAVCLANLKKKSSFAG